MSVKYLDSLILRLDFLSPIEVYDKLDAEVVKEITKVYKKAQPKTQKKNVLFVSTSPFDENRQPSQMSKEEVQWTFNAQRKEQLTIGSNEIVVSSTVGFEKHVRDNLFRILKIVFEKYSPQLRRIGIRYINKIPFDKENYVNSKLLYFKDLYSGYNVATARSVIELKKEINDLDVTIRIQHGKDQSDEINALDTILLDLDGFTADTVYEYSETVDFLDKLHAEIRSLFFSSITEEYKKELPL